ncbi:MAG: competence/damage-inducible protein A [Gemmatimonadota bacterium]|nr:competence/damage-inducible protein A [Gemmatimonadota bacterium]MDH4350388.1 competence/damage-inducible protein A [Gemmatimonadota bacterium]MDH5195888.1 competence/damage-inducible protein A [Gemmatimonadota bacterium]
MDLELVTIGTELLLGHTIDTNAAYLANALAAVGAHVVRKTSVPDTPATIRDVIADGLARSGFVVTTGGLGPTRDDVTKHAVAALFGRPLITDETYLASLEARWERLGRGGPMPEANRTQAQRPEGAVVLPNPRGTAPGLWVEGAAGIVVLLPGVPHEMRALTDRELVPRLVARTGGTRVTRSRVLRTTGVPESRLADRVGPMEAQLTPVTVAYLPSFDGVDLRLTAWDVPATDADAALDRGAVALQDLLGSSVYGEGETDLAAVVLDLARAAGVRIAVAESCTGGLVAGRLTAVPGASDVFAGGVIAYDNAVKTRDLGVAASILATVGAVSEETVRAMVAGVRARFGVETAVAVSGVAGPDGGTADKPVGTVWLCAACGERVLAVQLGLPGDRNEIRTRAAQAALDLVRRVLRGPEGVG